MQRIVSLSADKLLTIMVDRGGLKLTLMATPKRHETTDRFGNKLRRGLLGIRRNTKIEDWKLTRYGPVMALWKGCVQTWNIVETTMIYLYDVVAGRQDADQLGGPLRIAQVAGQAASVGFLFLINLAAVLSVSIGLINLFPIPVANSALSDWSTL